MAEGKILPYLDIPFQHGSPSVLKRMKRPAFAENTLERIKRWREICPELTIRSTFIVGFPGETEEEFQELLDWLEEAQLDRVGCFEYSAVDGADANELADPVPDAVKKDRWNRFMEVAQRISAERLAAKVGSTQLVIIDEVNANGAIGRSTADAPEIDGRVHLADSFDLAVGDVIEATITGADEYDLFATPVYE
jgi:ribosomal protein S12 methylthiotransferase